MVDLCHHHGIVRRKEIARRNGIPGEYLDQILILLRKAGLVKSIRGRMGGYELAKDPAEISVWHLLSSVENSIEPVRCLSEASSCGFDTSCSSHDAWKMIFESIRSPLVAMTLADVVRNSVQKHQFCPAAGIRECKPPTIEAWIS